MSGRNEAQTPNAGLGLAAVVIGAALGVAGLLLSTKQGQRLLEQVGIRADDWKAQAAATLAETREKVVSSVESELLPPMTFPKAPARKSVGTSNPHPLDVSVL